MQPSRTENIVSHTAGPWRIESIVPKGWITPTTTILGPDGRSIVGSVHWMSDDGSEGQANASLIAAAPELLEAAKRALAWYEPRLAPGEEGPICRQLAVAIAKAEGRES